ncbi:C4-dicarboxylate transporter DcuC [Tindallia californiensis]|uniref:C4-dicarboxylate transporter, DcuC family n=1 Tax=Tindallia californiensis TaxID=159292 RepID=A0A1H3MHG2_9FIRM|nr:C4-dicarboxylate transporter DcuC [Tindallia californiensis]SDY75495.1 C4-dicarboxylate transporter, DcuC family [Tindallia californiensis]
MFGVIIALVITGFVARLILKKYKPQPVLMMGGMLLMSLAIILGTGEIVAEDSSTGFIWFDIFEFMKNTFSNRAGGLGLIIISVAGFARYMDHTGASKALVSLTIKPLQALNKPYLVLALGYIVGQILNIFVPSASGVGLLLMVTMYPLLISLGVSKLAATAMIGTTACMDLGPASGNANLAAATAELDVAIYFAQYQVPVAIAVAITIAVLHYFTQKRFDQKAGHDALQAAAAAKEEVERLRKHEGTVEEDMPPMIYAILPLIPLVLIFTFSSMVIDTINMHVVTAMLISLFISMVFEFIRHKNAESVLSSIMVFFDAMGTSFARVVTLIIAGETFARGLTSIGAIDTVINASQDAGFGPVLMILIMTAIIAASAVVMGSGNAPFFAFAALAPDVSTQVGIPAVVMLLPMQFAASIARSVSPITAVIVAVAGVSDVNPVDVVKRTAVPMAGALIVTIIMNFILFL